MHIKNHDNFLEVIYSKIASKSLVFGNVGLSWGKKHNGESVEHYRYVQASSLSFS